jgi:hypothetical protein
MGEKQKLFKRPIETIMNTVDVGNNRETEAVLAMQRKVLFAGGLGSQGEALQAQRKAVQAERAWCLKKMIPRDAREKSPPGG